MTELKDIKEHFRKSGKKLKAGDLEGYDRVACFIMHNRIVNVIDMENPSYRTIAELNSESIIAIQEMRGDVERMISRNYSDTPIVDNLLFADAIEELSKMPLETYEDCTAYLTDLAVASFVTMQSNVGEEKGTVLLFRTLVYICVIALNRFNEANRKEIIEEGVEISFDKKRTAAIRSWREGTRAH